MCVGVGMGVGVCVGVNLLHCQAHKRMAHVWQAFGTAVKMMLVTSASQMEGPGFKALFHFLSQCLVTLGGSR